MPIWIGTSGYNYPEWKGSFYPETLPAAKMLPYYAARFPTVEINYTFYRAPNEKILAGWNTATPERFKLTLKAPKRITHDSRLRDCGDRVRQFLETASSLGPKLGALLFQLPPNLKKDLVLFDAFLETFPPRVCAAFEFRHACLERFQCLPRLLHLGLEFAAACGGVDRAQAAGQRVYAERRIDPRVDHAKVGAMLTFDIGGAVRVHRRDSPQRIGGKQ